MEFSIAAPPATRAPELQRLLDGKTKPRGSLGRLEPLALQIGLVQDTLRPALRLPHLLLFAADHGAARAGLSAYPQEVTWQMVENLLAGGAAANVLARSVGLAISVIDAGVAHDFGARPGLLDAKIAPGTASFLDGAAMSPAQCEQALARGAALAQGLARDGCNVVALGEMGIGNTSSAALLTHCLTDAPLAQCVGPGTGLDAAGVARKRATLERALAHRAGERGPQALLARYGGFEIAMMTGAMLAAAQARMIVLVDGFIAGAAALVAHALHPQVLHYFVFGHASAEPGHRVQLAHLGARALLDLDLRLGEGTGAVLAYPLLAAAVAILNEMASFDSAGVSGQLPG